MKALCVAKETIVLIRVVVLLLQSPAEGDSFQERYGDGVAWGGCTIVYLLGQETRFELLDFSYHVLAVAESDTLPTSLAYIEMVAKGTTSYSIVSNLTISI
jgi:cytoplasmic FMR1 interacting protein